MQFRRVLARETGLSCKINKRQVGKCGHGMKNIKNGFNRLINKVYAFFCF